VRKGEYSRTSTKKDIEFQTTTKVGDKGEQKGGEKEGKERRRKSRFFFTYQAENCAPGKKEMARNDDEKD